MRTTGREVEGIVSNWLEQRVVDPPRGSLQAALARAEQTPQQHHRWLRWWFGRGPGATDGQMDRRLSGLTALFASVTVLALVAVLAIPRQLNDPPPPDVLGITYSVAAENADFTTIAEAVARAQDGDTVLVEPGTYDEALVIDKDITIAGTGDLPRDVVVRVPSDAPSPAESVAPLDRALCSFEVPAHPPVGLQLLDSDATLRNLLVMGQADGLAMLVRGGQPTLVDVIVRHPGERDTNAVVAGGLFVDGAAAATVRGGQIWHRIQIDGGSTVTFSDALLQYPKVAVQTGSHLIVKDSKVWASEVQPIAIVGGATAVITDTEFHGGGVDVIGGQAEGTQATFEGDAFASAPLGAVRVSDGATATVERNSFVRNYTGVSVSHADPLVIDNDFVDNDTAVTLSLSSAELEGNGISGGGMGIVVIHSGSPVIRYNEVKGVRARGMFVGGGTSPTLDGNIVCGSSINLYVEPAANPVLGQNDICPDGTSVDG